VENESQWKIIIAERGWVYVGRPRREGDQLVISECFNIARWAVGGLGRLAKNGPSKEDTLYDYGTISLHVFAIPGGAIECNDEAWNAWRDKSETPKSKAKK
jgi:hypothetical protein